MAIRRTKEQKQITQQKRVAALQYSYRAPVTSAHPQSKPQSSPTTITTTTSTRSAEPTPKSAVTSRDLFQYDVRLIFQDLLKTVVITTFIFVLLIGITWYLRR